MAIIRVRGKKPNATVYARYPDPDRPAANEELPIYMAGQLYGAGRVFYEGSGEMWRLRAMDESYFEQFYTKLLRYVSQGRMLRGSRRGNICRSIAIRICSAAWSISKPG